MKVKPDLSFWKLWNISFGFFGVQIAYALRGYVADTDPCKDEREQETYEAARITQETLDGVGEAFLLFVHHVAYHHLEWLHRHIDGGIQEHQ